METRKLYYEDSHLKTFSAKVLSCEEADGGWEIILDATAFYPEGGGQACDLGVLGGSTVLDVQERGAAVVHLCHKPLTVGETVEGTIDWARRFDLMQQHSGEHIVSGLVHSLFGYHNVGFHVGAELVTIDFDGVIPVEDLPAIEWEANRAIWENVPIRCWYPTEEELSAVFYRTKRALPWPVRIVEIPGFDSCACCGTHVKATGEIGLIKLFTVMGFRGGTRMEMACGSSALKLLNEAYEQNRQVSQAFSAKIQETGEAARRMNEVEAQLKYQILGLQKRIFNTIAAGFADKGHVVHFEEGLDNTAVRDLADAIAETCGDTAAVFSGSEEAGYAFCLVTRNGDLRQLGKEMTKVLNGRGGGKPVFQQGRVQATKAEIAAFFAAR